MSSTTASSEQRENMWILNLIGILFFAGLVWLSYSKITGFEAEGGYLRLPKILELLYDLVGKWGVVGFWLLIVLPNIVSGIKTVIKENKRV